MIRIGLIILFNIFIIQFYKDCPILFQAIVFCWLCVEENFIISTFKSILLTVLEKNKYTIIDSNDKNKYKYYRDLLHQFNIAEIGYIYNRNTSIETLTYALLEEMILNNKIKYEDGEINLLVGIEKLDNLEHYVISNIKNIKKEKQMDEFIKIVQKNLTVKNILKLRKLKFVSVDKKKVFFITHIFVFVLFAIFMATFGQDELPIKMAITVGLLFFTYPISAMIGINIGGALETKLNLYYLTKEGKEVYSKLAGLKRFLTNFANFKDKELEEIKLWGEYILYSIIFRSNEDLVSEIKEKYKILMEEDIN